MTDAALSPASSSRNWSNGTGRRGSSPTPPPRSCPAADGLCSTAWCPQRSEHASAPLPPPPHLCLSRPREATRPAVEVSGTIPGRCGTQLGGCHLKRGGCQRDGCVTAMTVPVSLCVGLSVSRLSLCQCLPVSVCVSVSQCHGCVGVSPCQSVSVSWMCLYQSLSVSRMCQCLPVSRLCRCQFVSRLCQSLSVSRLCRCQFVSRLCRCRRLSPLTVSPCGAAGTGEEFLAQSDVTVDPASGPRSGAAPGR